ncbi:MAG: thioredoxin fold domain-containing protein [Deltaproteobacteria bacterium]|nr:thioredoxin fold domain-containing protein [Deltaproteobacteria bacterium]
MKIKVFLVGGALLVLVAGALSYLYLGGKDSGKALASVNGEKITVDQFVQEIEKIEEPTRGMFKEDPAKFLDMMIMRALVLQEARKQGLQSGKEEKGEEALLQEFLQKKFSSPPTVSKEEVGAFYEVYKDRLEGKTLEEMAPMIEGIIRQQKQQEEYARFLEGLRSNAAVEINQERLKGLASKSADTSTNTEEDLAKALKSGRPVLVDFGSNSCIPCRQLRPILQEIRKEQEGKLEVLVIDIYKYQALAAEYRIQVMPTLVFFDSSGKEVARRQGFMPKTALMEELRKVGIS